MKVFISYSRPDRTFAERLRSDIVASGTDVLTDSEVLGAGETWDQGLRKALEASDAVVLVAYRNRARGRRTPPFSKPGPRALWANRSSRCFRSRTPAARESCHPTCTASPSSTAPRSLPSRSPAPSLPL